MLLCCGRFVEWPRETRSGGNYFKWNTLMCDVAQKLCFVIIGEKKNQNKNLKKINTEQFGVKVFISLWLAFTNVVCSIDNY